MSHFKKPLSEHEKVIVNHAILQKTVDILDLDLIPAQTELRDDIIKATEPLIDLIGDLFNKSAFTKEDIKKYKQYRSAAREMMSILMVAKTTKLEVQTKAITALKMLIGKIDFDLKMEIEEREAMKKTEALDQFIKISDYADMFYALGLRINEMDSKTVIKFNKDLEKLIIKYGI